MVPSLREALRLYALPQLHDWWVYGVVVETQVRDIRNLDCQVHTVILLFTTG